MLNSALAPVFVFLIWGGASSHADEILDARKAFVEIQKQFARQLETQGAGFSCFVKGGLSRSADHEIWMHQVYEEHKGTVLGDLMSIPEIPVYRTPKKGALRESAIWVPLISTPAGKRLDKVLHFPAEILRRAQREGLASARWVPVPELKEVELDHPDFAEPDDLIEEGGTAVAEKKPKFLYDRLTMRLSRKTAVEYFNDVQKSGCLGGLG
ncbi:MAG: hypothetical protein H2076_07685 [Planctomycetes bacterium]|nr:hypothetical protein [Planctomycetota bacterium]